MVKSSQGSCPDGEEIIENGADVEAKIGPQIVDRGTQEGNQPIGIGKK